MKFHLLLKYRSCMMYRNKFMLILREHLALVTLWFLTFYTVFSLPLCHHFICNTLRHLFLKYMFVSFWFLLLFTCLITIICKTSSVVNMTDLIANLFFSDNFFLSFYTRIFGNFFSFFEIWTTGKSERRSPH